MKKSGIFIFAAFLIAGAAYFVGRYGPGTASPQVVSEAPGRTVLRLGIIPERDVFQQRRAYRMLGDYLHGKDLGVAEEAVGAGVREPGARVEILTASSYAGALQDLEEGQVDAAFVGSLVAALAQDRCGAQMVLKSEAADGRSTYAGMVFVREDSPVRRFEDLMGKRIGGVKTTTAGAVYPLYLIRGLGWQARDVPVLVWSGTHDDVIREVIAGTVDAGAAKDLRFEAYQKEHPEVRLRALSASGRVPNNALVVRKDLPAARREKLVAALRGMEGDPAAAAALAALGYKRFVPADMSEYAPLYDMIEAIGPVWFAMDMGPAPRRPASEEDADATTQGSGDAAATATRGGL